MYIKKFFKVDKITKEQRYGAIICSQSLVTFELVIFQCAFHSPLLVGQLSSCALCMPVLFFVPSATWDGGTKLRVRLPDSK
jgi:hypothetical protein